MNWIRVSRFLPALLILGSVGGCSAWVLLPVFEHASTNARRSICQSNLKIIALACAQYAQDNDKKFPPISSNGKGWTKLISEKSEFAVKFSCPSGVESTSPSSDYFYNARLAKMPVAKMKEQMSTISFGEGMDNGPTNSHLLEAPIYTPQEENIFTKRHLEGANYAFADGHVKWLRANRVDEIFSFDPSVKANWP